LGIYGQNPSANKLYYVLSLNIFKNWHRHTVLGLVREHIKSIENVGKKEAFNLVLKPFYPENDKRSVFNHLYFTAYGFLVSDVYNFARGEVLEQSDISCPYLLSFTTSMCTTVTTCLTAPANALSF